MSALTRLPIYRSKGQRSRSPCRLMLGRKSFNFVRNSRRYSKWVKNLLPEWILDKKYLCVSLFTSMCDKCVDEITSIGMSSEVVWTGVIKCLAVHDIRPTTEKHRSVNLILVLWTARIFSSAAYSANLIHYFESLNRSISTCIYQQNVIS